MGSWDPGGVGSSISSGAYNTNLTEVQEFNSNELCAVPVGMCHAVKGAPASESMELLSSDVRVTCTNPCCDYGGPVHQSCLERWSSCCELRCRMLASTPLAPPSQQQQSAQPGRRSDTGNAMLDGLFTLYRCPQCAQCTLCRTLIHSSGQPAQPTQSDPHASMLGAIQYVNQQLSHTIQAGLISPTQTGNLSIQQPQQHNQQQPQQHQPFTGPGEGGACGADEPDRFALEFNSDCKKRSSWHTGWPNPVTSPGALTQYQMNQQTQLMRRLSLRCATGSTSSGSTSGFGSGVFGSSISTIYGSGTGDMSLDSSRKSSRNTCASDASDMFRMVAGTEEPQSGWCANSTPGVSTVPRALRGAGPLLSRHSVSGPGTRLDLGSNILDHLPPLRSNSPGPVGSSAPDMCENSNPLLCETGTTHMAAVGSGRRTHSTCMSGTGKALSFWPSADSTGKSCAIDDASSDAVRRKVVSRKGNIFKPRQDFTVFQTLPAYKQNAYFIQMDDDSCTGNEDTRAFLLAQLTNHRISEVACLACHRTLVVYDHFPVLDGIFFVSPVCHRSTNSRGHAVTGIRVTWHTNGLPTAFQPPKLPGANADLDELADDLAQRLLGSGKPVVPPPGCLGPRQQVAANNHVMDPGFPNHHHQHHNSAGRGGAGAGRQERYLHALCMTCMHQNPPEDDKRFAGSSVGSHGSEGGGGGGGGGIYCLFCNRPWSGASLLVGGLYTYDVLASWLCCPDRLTCNSCGQCLAAVHNRSEPAGCSSSDSPGTEKENKTSQPATGFSCPFPFFSQYSQLITCPFCTKMDYHFVKGFDKQFRTVPCPVFSSSAGPVSA